MFLGVAYRCPRRSAGTAWNADLWAVLPVGPAGGGRSRVSLNRGWSGLGAVAQQVAFPGLPRPAREGYAPRREPSPGLGSLPPRPCGPLCRPEVGVPGPARRPALEGYAPRREPSRQLGPCRRGPAGRCADRRSAFPGLRAALPVRGTRRDGSHPPGWGLCRRGLAGRCAGLKTRVPGPVRHPLCRGLGATFFGNRLRFSRVRFGP